jgi:hypothetical protein
MVTDDIKSLRLALTKNFKNWELWRILSDAYEEQGEIELAEYCRWMEKAKRFPSQCPNDLTWDWWKDRQSFLVLGSTTDEFKSSMLPDGIFKYLEKVELWRSPEFFRPYEFEDDAYAALERAYLKALKDSKKEVK